MVKGIHKVDKNIITEAMGIQKIVINSKVTCNKVDKSLYILIELTVIPSYARMRHTFTILVCDPMTNMLFLSGFYLFYLSVPLHLGFDIICDILYSPTHSFTPIGESLIAIHVYHDFLFCLCYFIFEVVW